MVITGPSTTGAAGRAARRIAALASTLALAACVAGQPRQAAEPPPDAPSPTAEAELTAVPRTSPEPPTPLPPPPELTGMNRADVVGILGEPVFQRHDAPALLMRYRGEGCILDLFLYPAADAPQAGGDAVEHVEARTADGRPAATKACISAVMKARAAATGGDRG